MTTKQDLNWLNGENAFDAFERIATLFQNDTGYLRPGKDCVIHPPEDRQVVWDRWLVELPEHPMIIDVPFSVVIDGQRSRDFTVRFDLNDDSIPAKATMGDLDQIKSHWFEFNAFFSLISSTNYESLKKRANKWPADYCVDKELGEKLQAEVDK